MESIDQLQQSDGFFALLLHKSLKAENLAAIVSLNDEWYAAVLNSNDQKKKPNLILSIFEPGKMNLCCQLLNEEENKWNYFFKKGNAVLELLVSKDINKTTTISANVKTIKSYTKGCIIWYLSNNLVVSYTL